MGSAEIKRENDQANDESKAVFTDNPRLDRHIIEGMLNDRELLMVEMQNKGFSEGVILSVHNIADACITLQRSGWAYAIVDIVR